MDVKINLYRAEHQGDGELKLYVSLTNGYEREEKEFIVSIKQYTELGGPKGEISLETYSMIEEAEELHRAIKKGMGILLYGDNTEKKLMQKLAHHGFSRGVSEKAVAYLRTVGFVDEEKIAHRVFDSALKKGYGRMRIYAEMIKKGVRREMAERVIDENDVDYARQCAIVIMKKWGTLPTERVARAKAIRSLLALGYTFDEININEE